NFKKEKNAMRLHDSPDIRRIYYALHPDDEGAKTDSDQYIRLWYYRRNPLAPLSANETDKKIIDEYKIRQKFFEI
ncbi:hypothetical protein D6827_03065, partial [Candidatus Parcubacteria bacterium]